MYDSLRRCDDLDHEFYVRLRLYCDFTIRFTTVSGFATTPTMNSTAASGFATAQTMNSTTVSGSVQAYATFCDSLRLRAPP